MSEEQSIKLIFNKFKYLFIYNLNLNKSSMNYLTNDCT